MSFSNKVKTFEAAIRYSEADESKTFAAWQKRAIITRNALLIIIDEHKKEVESLADTYSSKEFDKRVAPLREEMDEVIKIAKQRCMDDLKSVMTEKHKQLDHCLEAPSEEALRLLNVLNMRTNLTQREIESAARGLNNNIHALRLLRDIAERNGLYMSDCGNMEEIQANLDEAEKFGTEIIDTIATENLYSDSIDSRRLLAFWKYPGTSEVEYFSELIDQDYFTAAQASEAARAKVINEQKSRDVDNSEGHKPNAARVYLRGDESLGGISMQFGVDSREIRAANPGFDFSNLNLGDSIVVPSGHFKIINTPGSVIPDQVVPTYFDPSSIPSPAKAGTTVDINTL